MELPGIAVLILLVVFLGITILVHEFGHYLSARALGLVVEVFSMGFGPAIWKKRRKGIVYKIGLIPFGGYVALPQIDPAGMSRIQTSESDGSEPKILPPAPAWKKIVVSLAGATGNVLLAVLIAWIVYWVGIPQEFNSAVGFIDRNGEAYAQGLRLADRILSVNGRPVRTWRDARMEAALATEVTLVVAAQDSSSKTIRLKTEKAETGERMIPGVLGPDLCKVDELVEDSAAREAGAREGDCVLEVNGVSVLSAAHVRQIVQEAKGRPVALKIRRPAQRGKSEDLALTVAPRLDSETNEYRLGIKFSHALLDTGAVIRPTPCDQLRDHATAIFRVLAALTNPKTAGAAQSAVGGPVAVILGIWHVTKLSFMLAVWFIGFLNVNLAIINLLPIPVLDGGHILFSLWEAGARRPVPEKVAGALVNVCMALLMGLLVFLSVRDLDRFTTWGARARRMVKGNPDASSREPDANPEETDQPNSGAPPSSPPEAPSENR
ncbi:MAG: RIP metalloprotease RseP [Verrucomicrobiota bacterium]|nr:RIP metalloprotease RseP [Verrucomicrobiota bacterium]